MAEKYIKLENGTLKESEALTSSTGASDAGKMVALGSTGRLDVSMMPTGIGADTVTLPAFEAIPAGKFVNIFDDSGTAKCRKADGSTAGKEAVGFVLAGVDAGENALVYFEGCNDQLTGLTAGQHYLSADTPGESTPTPPTAPGSIVQRVGFAVSADTINVEFGQPIELA